MIYDLADDMEYHAALDATGLLCPLPVLKARKALKGLDAGQVLRLMTDDPAARIDVPHFCAQQRHRVVKHKETAGADVFYLLK